MARVSKVLAVILVIVFTSASFAALSPEKAAYMDAVYQAKSLYDSGVTLTLEQEKLLRDEGIIRDARHELDNFGGPDEFGYSFVDSNELDGPVFEWVDISETGIAVTNWSDDTNVGPFNIGFDFPFYGISYSQIWVCSNGWITFSDGQDDEYANTEIPDEDIPNNAIYWCWDDWRPDAGNSAWYGLDEDGNFVFQFAWPDDDYAGVNDSEIILYPDGTIKIQYGENFVVRDNNITIGLENADGTIALQAMYNDNVEYPSPGYAIQFDLLNMGRVSGLVFDNATLSPIPGAEVTLYMDGEYYRSVFANDNGEYSFLVEVNNYTVSASAFTYIPSTPVGATVVFEGNTVVDIGLDQQLAPEITLDPDFIDMQVGWNGNGSREFSITNTGGSTLDWYGSVNIVEEEELAQYDNRHQENTQPEPYRIPSNYVFPKDEDLKNATYEKVQHYKNLEKSYNQLKNNVPLTLKEHDLLANEGIIPSNHELDDTGADEFGYYYTDIVEDDCPAYEWIDISETGTEINNWDDDINLGPFDIGFDFEFYGVLYTQFWICSNGWITFTDTDEDEYTNRTLPDATEPNNAIYYCWDDWRPDDGYSAWYGLDRDGNCVIQFGWPDDDYAGVNDSEVVLFMNGAIKIQYGPNFTVRDNNITIGIENADGSIGLQSTYNNNVDFPYPGYAILFHLGDYTGQWVSLHPDEGTLEPQASQNVNLWFDAFHQNLDPGTYEAVVTISTDFPGVASQNLWVTLSVTDPGSIEGTVTDVNTGDPLPGAEIREWLHGEEDPLMTYYADENGFFSFPVGDGTHLLTAVAEDYYESEAVNVDVIEGVVTTHNFELTPHIPPVITVNPDAFTWNVDWLGSTTDILNIGNIGGLDLDFDIDIDFVPQEEMAGAMIRARAREIRRNLDRPVIANTINLDSPNSQDEEGAERTQSTHFYSELDDPYFLVIQDQDPWGGNLTHQEILAEFEIPFDVVGSEMFATADFSEYTVLMIPSCQEQTFYDTFAENYDRISEWVDDGGWLEFHGCTQNRNWTLWDGTRYVHQTNGINRVVVPDHPTVIDIPEEFTGGSASHGYMVDVPEEALVIITESNDRPVLIETAYGRGNMIVTTETWEFGANANPVQGAGVVMRNSIIYAIENAGDYNWLGVTPGSGIIAPDGDLDIDLDVDANRNGSELDPGVYEAFIIVEGSHPETEPATVWATLIVGTPGTIEGTVSDAETGDGLFEVEVIIWDEEGEFLRSTFTDENGDYSILIGEGTWDVSAQVADYYESDVVQVMAVNDGITVQNFQLNHHIPATIDVNLEQLTFVSAVGGSCVRDIMVSNNGGLPLNYDIYFEYLEDEEIAQRIIETGSIYPQQQVRELDENHEVVLPSREQMAEMPADKAEYYRMVKRAYNDKISGRTLSLEKRQILEREGLVKPLDELDQAVEANGYFFTDSEEADCPDYEWIDISEFGTEIRNWSDDTNLGPFPVGFEFPFFDNMCSEFWICSNGWITFTETEEDEFSNRTLPDAIEPNNAIYWCWDDWRPDANDVAWYAIVNDHLVIQFGWADDAFAGIMDCEVILYPNGAIKVQYGPNFTVRENNITIGIENADGSAGLMAFYNDNVNYPYPECVNLFHLGDYTGGWMSADPGEGVIEIGEDRVISITADSGVPDLAEDNYYGLVEIESDHPDTQPAFVWTRYIVGAGAIFNPINPTGLPYPMVINEVLINGEPIGPNGGIGVYDGDVCVGSVTTSDEWPRSLVAWGQNEEQGIPGFTSGNPMTFRIWTEELDDVITAIPTYIEGDGNFGTMPYAELTLRADEVPTTNYFFQDNYFELISFCVVPEVIDAAAIFDNIANFAIAYESSGDIYLPPDLNFIGDIDFSQGYRVFCYENSSLTIQGEILDPNTQFTVEGGIWNWIGYPFYHQVPVEVALSNIVDDVNIVLADDGRLWIPGIINNMENMIPGEGYMLFPDSDLQFTYVDNAVANIGGTEEHVVMPMIEGKPASTGMPYAVVVNFSDDALALEPATIEIYDGSTLVGKEGVLEDSPTPVIAWQGNSDYNVSGFTPGNNMSIVVRSADGTKLPLVSDGNKPAFGEDAFANLTLKVVEMPTEFAVEQGYPNPFNPTVTVPFAIPGKGDVAFTVFNVLGQEVFHSSQSFDAGFHRFMFDANGSGSELVSGMYFLKVDYQGQANTQKLMLLK